jgi:hypothetical protein
LQPGTRDVLLAGPVPFASDDGEVVVPLLALAPLEAGATVHLTVALHARSAIPAGSEFALAVVGNAAWRVTAAGAGNPHLAIEGAARIAGPVLRVGAAVPFPGDADGDGQLTVADLRRLCLLLGRPAQGVDPDGDGQITAADLLDLRDCILGRSIVLSCPAVLTRGSWFAVRGWFANGNVPQVAIGGRALGVGAVTSREFTARVDEDLPLGDQELVITLVDGRSFVRRVDVQ